MKIVELTHNKLLMPITNEELEMLEERFDDRNSIAKACLCDREIVLANQLTVKEVLLRHTDEDGKLYYTKI